MGDRRVVIPRVPAAKFAAVCEALDRVGVAFQVASIDDAAAPAARMPTPRPEQIAYIPAARAPAPEKRRTFQYVGGRRFKGISGTDLVLQILLTAPTPQVALADIEAEFVKYNFSKNSAASRIGKLVATKKVVRVRDGVYCATVRFIPEKREGAANGM